MFAKKHCPIKTLILWAPPSKYVTIFSIIFIFAFSFINCGQKDSSQSEQKAVVKQSGPETVSAKDRNTLIRDLDSDPQYLNPILTNDVPSSRVERLLFDSLLDIDGSPDSNLVGRLAESWEISADKLAITFHLRSNVSWHDGEPFTAADVQFTFETAMRDDIPAIGMKSTIEPVERVHASDDRTVIFFLKYPFSPSLQRLGRVFIVPQHRLDERGLALETERRQLSKPVTFLTSQFNREPIGTGPYLFQEWKTAQYIKLTKNVHYYDQKHQPKISELLIKIIPNRTAAFNILQKNSLDVLRARSMQYLRFQRLPSLQQDFIAKKFFEPAYYYVGYNLSSEKPFFNDKMVRQAMTHAVDRQAFIDKALYGLGHICTGPFYFRSWALNPNIEPLPYDLVKASKLLEAAGWHDSDGNGILDKKGVQFEFELLLPLGAPGLTQLAHIVQANVKKLAIEATIRTLEWSVYLEKKRSKDFDAFVGGWGLDVDPDVYSIWHSSQINNGNNYIGYRNNEVDQLLEQGRREFERQKRQKIYWRIQEIMHDEQPCTFVYTRMETYIISKRIANFEISPFGLFDFFPGQLSWTLE
ncbi:peptide-binding protein [candidate division CSSED10-310 bacterium]|uniref:Peptide-binding protein n=1 Tax=candidate division CSSED10-310 bacterium TaxID=2855610 RepID=A0ABV6YVS9_UNCC1